jgi:hypothetical protein
MLQLLTGKRSTLLTKHASATVRSYTSSVVTQQGSQAGKQALPLLCLAQQGAHGPVLSCVQGLQAAHAPVTQISHLPGVYSPTLLNRDESTGGCTSGVAAIIAVVFQQPATTQSGKQALPLLCLAQQGAQGPVLICVQGLQGAHTPVTQISHLPGVYSPTPLNRDGTSGGCTASVGATAAVVLHQPPSTHHG